MWLWKISSLSILLCCALAKHPDEIIKLPGVNFPLTFKQYSGYLNASEGKYLHYWFVESQSKPSTDPLLLWLNGGPGCSSMEGMLAELGPFHVNPDGKTLFLNKYSWNNAANVIFLEAPAGVGYSYADNEKYGTDDDAVSNDNYLALQHFFVKHPQFKKNDFYITGESYAGIYIPTLSVRVSTGAANINFKGFAIGNGYLDIQNLTNSIVFFAYYHGLIGKHLWKELSEFCCNGIASQETCDFQNPISPACVESVQKVSYIVGAAGLNIYNLYGNCSYSTYKHSSYSVHKRNLLNMLTKSNNLLAAEDLPCVDSSLLVKYMNAPSVRNALHIPAHLPDWEECSSQVSLNYKRIYDSMRPQLLQLLSSGKLRGLIYNGDIDMACNFLGDEWFSYNLGLKVLKEYSPWKSLDQIGGFVKYYDKNLTFLTIRGSGHMVPQDKPEPALKMITSFLNNMPY